MKNNLKTSAILVTALFFPVFIAGPVLAGPVTLSETKDWRFDVTGYLFLPASLSGTSTVAGSDADLDLNLRDALELIDFGGSASVEAWKGDFGIIGDLNYVALAAGGTLTAPIAPNPSLNIDVDVKQTWFALMGAYRVAKGTYGQSGREFAVDIKGGARYNTLKQDLTVTGAGPAVNLGGTEHWLEPIIGVRGALELSDKWSVVAMADVAGFGVSEINHHFSATLGFEYQGWENTALKFGWKYYSIDYQTTRTDGAFGYDVTQSGPIFGLTYSF